MKSNKFRFFIRAVIFIFSSIWIIGIVSPCFNNPFTKVSYPLLKLFYSHVCHQSTAKSFFCNNNYFLVCARCSGIYFAVLITSFITLFITKPLKIKTSFLILLSIPMFLDVVLYNTGTYQYNKFTAYLTGLLFGSAVFLYILSGIENSFFQKQNLKNES